MTTAEAQKAMAVPTGPPVGRNVFPGITNTPQPMIPPSENDQASKGDSRGAKCLFVAIPGAIRG